MTGEQSDNTLAFQINLASWNLRYDSQPDNIPVSETLEHLGDPLKSPDGYLRNTGERPWSQRRVPVANTLLSSGADIIGTAFFALT